MKSSKPAKSLCIHLVLILLISTVFTSCLPAGGGRQLVNLSFPFGIRAQKKKLAPSLEFISAVFKYKREKGAWPNSEKAFEITHSNSEIVNRMYMNGFISWEIAFLSKEIMVINFVHQPVYTQTIGLLSFPGRKVKFRTTFYATGQIHTNELY